MNALLDVRAVDAPPGPAWCRAWTGRVDTAIREWTRQLRADRGMAVVALGSYARQELCPGSDVDLLLLHGGWARTDLADLVRQLCYPLWDAGLQVGHGVHTPVQAVRAAGEGIDAATALIDRRLVAGDHGLADDLGIRAARWLRRSAGHLLADLTAADRRRRAQAGWRPGMLEPHLKNGAGGLRDLQGLRWAAACLLGEAGLDPLVGAHYLGAAGRRELAAAGDTLLAARCALHLVRGAAGRAPGHEIDRLRLDLQDETASRLGLDDGSELLWQVGLSTRTISYLHERTWPQLLDDAQGGRRWLRASGRLSRGAQPEPLGDGLRLQDGAVAADEDRTLAAEPGLVLRALATAGQRGMWLHRLTAERLRREIAAIGTLPWDDAARRGLLELLRGGATALPAIRDADHLGVLPAYLPEWNRVRGRPQRNPLHLYDLDTHLYQTVAELADIGHGALGDREAALFEGLESVDTLLIGAVLHDVGKAWPGDHSVVGARLARQWIPAIGFAGIDGERVAALVRHHLLLPDVATRRDLDDERELQAVADAVGDAETLDGLYLLSLADARATGPSAHSPWKDGLLAELHGRVRRILCDGIGPVVPGATAVSAAVRQQAPGDEDVEALLSSVTPRYLIAAGVGQVLAHARLVRPRPAPGELRAAARPGPARGTVTITIVAGDRRGLMAECAGVLAAHGLTVLDARAFTTEGGLALDWFVVRPGDRGGADVDLQAVEDDLVSAAAAELDVAAAVAARERRRDARPQPLAAPVPIDITFDLREGLSRIEVHGPDTPGLLYRLAHVLAAAGADVLGARVATLGPEVRDVFFVRLDADDEARSALALALRDAATPRI